MTGWRPALHFAAAAAVAIVLAGCWRSESDRYKLTLVVNTKDGIKRGSSVGEVVHWEVSIPARGIAHKLRGEALYLDLGPRARPLIALLTRQLHPKFGEDIRWTRDAGPDSSFWLRLYGETPSLRFLDDVVRIAHLVGPRRMTPDDLPDLVTFADVNDPKTVIEVDPNDLQATLGPGVTWNEITLEGTEEPITTGLETKLPWLLKYQSGMLDGERYSAGKTLANVLSAVDFQQPVDPKK